MIRNDSTRRFPTISSDIPRILKDPTTSYWLKDAIVALRKRDVVDALNDVEILLEVLTDDLSKRDFDRFLRSDQQTRASSTSDKDLFRDLAAELVKKI